MAAQQVIEVHGLPAAPLDAAARFFAGIVPQVRDQMRQGDVAVILPPADHAHAAWRLAAVQELAREAAPMRVNAVEGADPHAVRQTLAFLQSAPGVTGQVLAVAATRG